MRPKLSQSALSILFALSSDVRVVTWPKPVQSETTWLNPGTFELTQPMQLLLRADSARAGILRDAVSPWGNGSKRWTLLDDLSRIPRLIWDRGRIRTYSAPTLGPGTPFCSFSHFHPVASVIPVATGLVCWDSPTRQGAPPTAHDSSLLPL